MKNSIRELKKTIFSDVPFIPGEGYFAVGEDSVGRQIIVACRDETEAKYKKTLLNELMREQENQFDPVFLIDEDDGPFVA